MTVSMRVMTAGDGYKYLLRSVAAGDGDRSLSTPLTRYYAEAGNPPGFWIGQGLAALGHGELATGSEVSEAQLELLIGSGRDPITGDPLGKAYPTFAPVAERIERRVKALDADLGPAARAVETARIEAEETERGTRRAVAGFDFTFSAPKSVSALWAVADAGIQALIADAHHAAVAELIAFLEREVAVTRTGADGPEGTVAHVDVLGVAATAFDHYDSRAGDPQLHTHVVISNKVKTAQDGKWRALAGRPMHAAVVAVSELYNAALADQLTRTLGIEWDTRDRGRDRNPAWELVGVTEELIGEFSTRSRHIEAEKDRLIAEYVATHGRQPSARIVLKLRAQATLVTRPEKHIHSLADLTRQWRERAARVLGQDATGWARALTHQSADAPARVLRADDVPLDVVREVGLSVMATVSEKRSTWTRWNLHAEASRQLMGWRFASMLDREAITGLVVDAAEQASLRLTPPELASSPVQLRRADGTSRFRPHASVLFSSEALLAAEDRLLARAESITGPVVSLETVEQITSRPDARGRMLGEDQTEALAAIAVSGRALDVLVGPAGAGKTTAMSALRRAWEKEHGSGSVVGLAPSAVAAQVLADDLGIVTENTAKWWQNHLMHGTTFEAGQLVIIDEASLAGTASLDRITAKAEQAGAKVLLVGDWGQLQSVDAGGAFSMLVYARDDTPELLDIHRFTHAWEKTTSLQLRHGRPEAIDTLIDHDRITGGDQEAMIDAAYIAWRHDLATGRASILVAETHETVTALNTRARADRIIDGTVHGIREVELHDGTAVSEGDLVITRRNDRRLRNGRSWVRNGDRWTVTGVHSDGSVSIHPVGRRLRGGIVLPADYVAEHLDLGYAITAHRAQGVTTDTAHVIATVTTTRENFYVAMTRGADGNYAYVVLDRPDDGHGVPHPSDNPDATERSVLYGVIQHIGAELSAHETITAEQERWSNIGQLAAEYETIAQAAQHDRWATLFAAAGLTGEQVDAVLDSDAYPALSAELRHAEANHHDLDALLPRLVAARGLDDAEDIASVIHARVARATSRPAGSGRTRKPPRLIAGLVPYAGGPMADDMRQALDERHELIEARAKAVLAGALADKALWTAQLGPEPKSMHQGKAWRRAAAVVATYRDRYQIADDRTPLGPPPQNTRQKIDRARADAALRELNAGAPSQETGHPVTHAVTRGPRLYTLSVVSAILDVEHSIAERRGGQVAQSEQAREVARRLGVVSHPTLEQLAEAVALFAPLGWAMCGRWHLEGTLRVLRLAGNSATDDELDEAITDVWNNENATLLKHAAAPMRRWSNSHYPFKQLVWDRVSLIEKAIEHHFAGAYEASTPIILAQIDGMSRDLTGQSFFSKGSNDPYLDDETIAGMETNLPVVRALFSEDVRPTGDYGKVSRHGVLHGRDLGYATRVNSTKTIVLVAALAEYLPKIADNAGVQLRRQHEDEVAGSTELDELGRLVDDRHVPEVLNFAYDFDTEYLNAVLLNPGPFNARRQLAAVARKHGLDPETFTLEEDQIGWRWHYTIPAGQTLGYAARPSTSSERRHPDVWRWDDPSTPDTFPWNDSTGWRSDDDFPRSPNWEPRLVM